MKTVLIATIFLTVAYDVSGREIPSDVSSRIVGGSTAPIDKYPYQVSLRRYFNHFCGGSIIDSRWILTAAHCITDKRPDEISVIAGTALLSESGQMYQAIYTTVHSDYDDDKRLNDIALILVSREIVFTTVIKPIALPKSDFTKVNYSSTVTGWGASTWTGDYIPALQEVSVTVISQERCKSYQAGVTNSHICTLDKPGIGVCRGDGGDPLVADGVQIGISAFIIPCAMGQPDVYTRVWSFVSWINTTINSNVP